MFTRLVTALCVLSCSAAVRADLVTSANFIANGTFDSGLSDWSTATNNPSTNWSTDTGGLRSLGFGPFAQTSTTLGNTFQRLFQEFTLPSFIIDSATLTWRDRFSSSVPFVDEAHEYRVVLQRVIAGTPDGSPFEVFSSVGSPTFVLPTNRGIAGNVTAFVLANLGQDIRLSYESLDSGSGILASVDNVSFVTTFDTSSVPEPSSLVLASLTAFGFAYSRRRKNTRARSADAG